MRPILRLCIQALALAAWLCACRDTPDVENQDVDSQATITRDAKSKDVKSQNEMAQAQATTIPPSPSPSPSPPPPPPPPPPPQVSAFVDHYTELGLELKAWASGNLNNDSLPDMILLFTDRKRHMNPPVDTLAFRPLVILVGTEKGTFRQEFVNWKAVLCATCGYRLSDPFTKIVINDGSFSLEHASEDNVVGWKRVTTFNYADSLKTWILDKDGMTSWELATEGEKPFENQVIKTRKKFGHIPIDSFEIYSLDDRYKDISDENGFPLRPGNSGTFLGHHLVKGGIWLMLDYCTDHLSQVYLFFAMSEDGIDVKDSDIGVEDNYRLVENFVADDSCEGFAIRRATSINPGQARKGRYDSAADTYHLDSDTIRFINEKQPSDANWVRLVFKRGRDTLILSDNSAGQHETYILYTGDINADGYLDFIKWNGGYDATTTLYVSKKESNGRVRMVVAGSKTFTD